MKKFSAIVKEGKKMILIENQKYKSKKAFIEDLRANGYKVDPLKVKESKVFSYIMEETNATPLDWLLIKKVGQKAFKEWDKLLAEGKDLPKSFVKRFAGRMF